MTETNNSPTKPNEPACTECSRLASRVEELEAALEHLVLLIGAKSTFTKTDRQVVELAVRAHGGIRNIFEEEV